MQDLDGLTPVYIGWKFKNLPADLYDLFIYFGEGIENIKWFSSEGPRNFVCFWDSAYANEPTPN